MNKNSKDKYLGRMLDNRYELLELIGSGGMAQVYKARCHLLNRLVAVKILREDMAADAEFRSRFKAEAQAVAMLSHPNIVAVYDVSRTPDIDYIVMELIQGVTLKTYMQNKGELNTKESVHFAIQTARALSHAHSKGIIHRDIKPQNVMICMDGSVKVADFGIAYLEKTSQQSDASETAVGSVYYMSPEQAKGQSVDARSDIYSLGVMMYEMMTGRLPYVGDSAEAVALQHVSATPTPPREINPEIPEALERIILKAMDGDIEKRYQSADELLGDLDEYRLSLTGPIPVVKVDNMDAAMANIPENVAPISSFGELNKEAYIRRRRRASKVSLLSGVFLVLAFALAVGVFLWQYWLHDVFAEPVRINIPNFVGSDVESVYNNKEFSELYNFTVEYKVDPDSEAGEIIGQEPAGHRSIMKSDDGIDVTLIVSTGIQMIKMPDVINKDYREAIQLLEQNGFVVERSAEASQTVTEDYVISSSPEAGDSVPVGAHVYISVSTGPDVITVDVPNVMGLGRYAAETSIENAGLSVGSVTYVESNLPEGTVILQRPDAYTVVDEHSSVYLQISAGPKVTEPPATEEPDTGIGEDGGN